MKSVVTLFTRASCSLCDSAKFVIKRAGARAQFEYKEIDIAAAGNEAWLQAYQYDIPVIHLNGSEIFRHRINEKDFLAALAKQAT